MRLIDVDKLPATCNVAIVNGKLELDGWIAAKRISEAPTVEAIPIEWIKDYIIPFQEFHDRLNEERKENDGAGWVVDVLEGMLKRWEKENGNI